MKIERTVIVTFSDIEYSGLLEVARLQGVPVAEYIQDATTKRMSECSFVDYESKNLSEEYLRMKLPDEGKLLIGNSSDQTTYYEMVFTPTSGEVLRLDNKGFHYKGETVNDAGKAHKLFVDFMKAAND